MNPQEIARISCPYCGEPLEILVDCSLQQQQYIEDCQVCCRPIDISISITDDEHLIINIQQDNA